MRHALIAFGLSVAVLAGCDRELLPIQEGFVLRVDRVHAAPVASGSLAIRWLGTACMHMQVGELSILMDPFVSNGFTSLFADERPAEVERLFRPLPAPAAMFVHHTHVDHFLDARAALDLWPQARIFVGKTGVNLLHGYGARYAERATDSADIALVATRVAAGRYAAHVRSYRTYHAPHTSSGITFFDGTVDEPLDGPPGWTKFQSGHVYNYTIEFVDEVENRTLHRVLVLGSPGDLDKLPEGEVDVLFMLSASAKNVEDYPRKWVAKLDPKYIIISHANNFLGSGADAERLLVSVDLPWFFRECETAVRSLGPKARFESLVLQGLPMGREGSRDVLALPPR